MKRAWLILSIALISMVPAPRCRALSSDDDPQTSHQLSLEDLAGYRAALSGKPTADQARASDPPVEAKFKDLWDRPDVYQGRRVTIQGRVMRVFRQGPVGSFPALAEVWMTSPAGDPFCVVCPQPEAIDQARISSEASSGAPEPSIAHGRNGEISDLGRTVRFTGTFLKMVRYSGGDGARLAPLIVGDRLPVPVKSKSAAGDSPENASAISQAIAGNGILGAAMRPAFWALGLAVLAAGAAILARWHMRTPVSLSAGPSPSSSVTDPSPEFIDSP